MRRGSSLSVLRGVRHPASGFSTLVARTILPEAGSRSAYAVGIHENLAGLASFQPLHGLLEIFHRNPIGDYGMQIEFPALEQRRHLIPGLVHAASVNALHRNAFENDVLGKVYGDGFRSQPQQRNPPAAAHDVERSSN